MRPTRLEIDKIRIDGGTQVRLHLDQSTVDDYAESMAAGEVFRAIDVFYDGSDYWLADGYHRLFAARKIGQTGITALVRQGTKDDALWWALNANRTNGLRMSRQDKENAIRLALTRWPEKSDRAIAEHVGVSDKTVARYRSGAEFRTSETVQQDQPDRVGRDGKTYPAHPVEQPETPTGEPDPNDIPLEMPEKGAAATEPQPPVEDKPLVDQAGKTVPPKALDAFKRRGEVTSLMSIISDLKGRASKLHEDKDPLYAGLNLSRFQADCNNVFQDLKRCRPHAVCPYCNGDGCQVCMDRGWVDQLTYDAAPSEMK